MLRFKIIVDKKTLPMKNLEPALSHQIASHAVSKRSFLITVCPYIADLAQASQIICRWIEVFLSLTAIHGNHAAC